MSTFKYIFVILFCANCVYGLYVPSNSADVESNAKKLIDDLTVIKNKLQPNDKGVSGLDEFDATNNANLLSGSSSILNDRSARFINFKKLIKLEHDHRNRYEHGRHYANVHKYCDNRSSEESVEDNISAFRDWVKYYKQFMTQSSTVPTTTITVEPTTETLTSSMAHDDEFDKIDVRFGEDFNEIELIRLIPSVIEHLKTNRLTQNDHNILSEIYGDLWLVMDEESKRDRENEKINPILKLILQLKHLHKRNVDIDGREYTNDYHGNTVEQIKNNDRDIVDQPLRIKLGLTENLSQLSPAQRILRTIAMLINNTRYNYITADQKVRDREHKNNKLRKFMHKSRAHPNVIRMRRSPLHHTRNNNIGNDIDLYDSDEQFYHRRVSPFDDNPSITELIKLAEIHRLRRQQKLNKNSISLIEKLYSTSMNDNYEYYYDDEPESDDNEIDDDAEEEYDEYDY